MYKRERESKHAGLRERSWSVEKDLARGLPPGGLLALSSKEERTSGVNGSYLVDPASSICLSQRLSHACPSINLYTVKLRMAHYISYHLFDSTLLHG